MNKVEKNVTFFSLVFRVPCSIKYTNLKIYLHLQAFDNNYHCFYIIFDSINILIWQKTYLKIVSPLKQYFGSGVEIWLDEQVSRG